ncbi:sensor histidine kinase [Caenimonas terrae]|uniref:histidine kinase n=1 Tax=Caenimonas terrae TaxID=696074 RepID=A0ABW0N9B1_9BURK
MSADSATLSKPTLQARLARRVMLPLVLTWAVGTAVAMAVANNFAGQAFDRALLDDAYALAASMRASPEGASLVLTPAELTALMFDRSESNYFAVYTPQGRLVGAHGDLSLPFLPAGGGHQFATVSLSGRELRTVALYRDQPAEFTVVLAQTTASRSRLLRRMLAYSAVPQVLLLLFLAWQLRRVIQRDLEPLAQLQQAVDQRDASDLTPVPEAITRDASTVDVERLGTALNSMLSRLAQSIAAQREFAGNVAHELRTPLAGIRAQAGYALAQNDPAVWREQLLGIAQGEQRASHLVNQLLALARADEGAPTLPLQQIDLSQLVRAVLLRFLPKADAKGVDLGGEGLEHPVLVRGDAALLEGILNNLLDNALRYGTSDQPRVTVAIGQEGEQVLLSVSDNGPGLAPQDAEQLGQRWAQGPAGQKLGEGAGLGLAIVGRYAELLGASFTLEAAPGGGLRAVLRLPAPPAQASVG